jgi:hypothetical protein
MNNRYEKQALLVAVVNDEITIITTIGQEAAEEFEFLGYSFRDHKFYPANEYPDKHGLYVWEGAIELSYDRLKDKGDARWYGTFRPARASDLKRFGLAPLEP